MLPSWFNKGFLLRFRTGQSSAANLLRDPPRGSKAGERKRASRAFSDVTGVPKDAPGVATVEAAAVTVAAAAVRGTGGATASGRRVSVDVAAALDVAAGMPAVETVAWQTWHPDPPRPEVPPPARPAGRPGLRPGSRPSAAALLNQRILECATAADVLAVFAEVGPTFDFLNLATSVHRLGSLGGHLDQHSTPILRGLLDKANRSVLKESVRWRSRELSSVAWALAKLNVQAPQLLETTQLLEAVASVSVKKMGTFNAQALANTVWAYAKAGFEAPLLFEAVAEESVKKIETFMPQNHANTVWAFAKAGFQAPLLFEAVALEAPKKMVEFNAQNLANTVWAYAAMGVGAPALFEAVAAEAPRKIATFYPQNLANTVWAYATAKVEAPALFKAAAAEASNRIAAFNPQDLANIVWAYATAGVSAPALFEAVAAGSSKKMIAAFNPQNLANTAWAYATAGITPPALFEAVAVESSKKIETFSPQNLAITLWAYATARVAAPALFEAAAEEAPKKIAAFNGQDLANTVWAYATAGFEAPALFEAVAAESSRKIATLNPQALANTAWAFVRAGVLAPLLFEVLALSMEAKMDEFNGKDQSQLHQVAMHLKVEAPMHSLTVLLSRHEAKLRGAYLRNRDESSRGSQTQRQVSKALSRIGWAHDFKVLTVEGIRLDMAQPLTKVAVEFAGPTHYITNTSDQTRLLDGKSKAKERLLRLLGWRVVHVPYYEWDALRSTDREKDLEWSKESCLQREAYLRGKLNPPGAAS